ncbi:MAG: SufD family Fe-S cluster assembly protein [Clostridia bacterium]|nr:SufD family Fe-S cluster assembly protein [Clostridia bacterium]
MEIDFNISKLSLEGLGLLDNIAGLTDVPDGAFNIRANGVSVGRAVTKAVNIVSKKDKPGIDIIIAPGTTGETVYIPVIITEPGTDLVYNDFYIGEAATVEIVAGCGIHNDGCNEARHDGIHTFHVGKNAHVRYVERHYGEGSGEGTNVMNPTTVVEMEKNSYMEMETTQIKGVDSTERVTRATLGEGAQLVIGEKIMTHGKQHATTDFSVDLNGAGSSANVVSRSVARDDSRQRFTADLRGNNRCHGHSECDAIVMDNAVVSSLPQITANSVDAELIHEAAIGKIAGEQLEKLMSLGLTEHEAETKIIDGFLK